MIKAWVNCCEKKYSDEINKIVKPSEVRINKKPLFKGIAYIVLPFIKDNKIFDQCSNRFFIACFWR